ncbi:major antigen-like [Gambusia affinis]|uniref:major antigen-like n=1 Tax=Gambusia affinis TaxID=33528 RepID=UPI001CDBEAB7|nr:major antigen-like [Gambusia affinis]
MCKTERQKAIAAFFDAEKMRRRNNRAFKKLLKINAELENASERRRRLRIGQELEKNEKEFFEESEKRLFILNAQSDIWDDEQERLDSLSKMRDKLFGILKEMNDQLVEEPIMTSMIKAAQQQYERLNFLHKVLKKNIRALSKHLVHQTKLFDEYTEKVSESKEMIAIQDGYFKELRKTLRVFNVANVDKKVMAEEERVKKAVDKNHKLEEMIKTLRQQAVNVPLLKYQFQCAVDEERRLKDLNVELDKVIRNLTDILTNQTKWDATYQDVDKKINNLNEIYYSHLKMYEDLTGKKIQVGSDSTLSVVPKEKNKKDFFAKRLHRYRSKIHALHQEYTSFQPEIQRFLGDLHPDSGEGTAESKTRSSIPSTMAWKFTGLTSKHREPEKFSDESSSETEFEDSETTEESTDDSRQKRSYAMFGKKTEKTASVKDEYEYESSTDCCSLTSTETTTKVQSYCKTSTDGSRHDSPSYSEEWWMVWRKVFF